MLNWLIGQTIKLTMKRHVAMVAASFFYHLCHIRQIRRRDGKEVTTPLVIVFITSRPDYCNSVLAGLPQATLEPLQRVQNITVHILLELNMRDHVTQGLFQLHWLPILNHIQFKLCMHGRALDWIVNFLSDRRQVVSGNSGDSGETTLLFGVPQGSILGPKFFIQYAEEFANLFEKYDLLHHQYADDMQELKHGKLVDVPAIVAAHEACLIEIRSMCLSRRLQLNNNKTELFWFVNLRKTASHTGDIRIGQRVVTPTPVVRDLGVLFDAQLSMREHVSKITQTCFYHL